jgi:predicted small secreted protein
MLKKIVAIAITLCIVGFAAGCNTMEGLGKDVERGGEKLQGSAKDTKKDM